MNLNNLKELWKKHDFRPSRRFGQNFLIDNNIRDKIFNEIVIDKTSKVIEIGPGFGMMTFNLADLCEKLILIEKDSNIVEMMRSRFAEKGRIEVHNNDVLDMDFSELSEKEKDLTIYGNIPYSITTPIILKIIDSKELVRKAYLVMQEEVAKRLVAVPGTKDYGSITCYVQFHARTRSIFRIKKNSFYPVPKVDSCLVEMDIYDTPEIKVKDKDLMFRIIRQAFSQRRKKVLNPVSYKGFLGRDKDAWRQVLTLADVDPSVRAEDLALADYARISDEVSNNTQ